jgi:hypothetical protein
MAVHIPNLPELFPFWTPDTPDLGCFVNRKHGLETYDFHIYGEPSPWQIVNDSLRFLDHQAYFRVACGKAGFFERCDDTGSDRDFDDLIVEVAVVRRPFYFDHLVAAERNASALERFRDEIEPKLERPDRAHPVD